MGYCRGWLHSLTLPDLRFTHTFTHTHFAPPFVAGLVERLIRYTRGSVGLPFTGWTYRYTGLQVRLLFTLLPRWFRTTPAGYAHVTHIPLYVVGTILFTTRAVVYLVVTHYTFCCYLQVHARLHTRTPHHIPHARVGSARLKFTRFTWFVFNTRARAFRLGHPRGYRVGPGLVTLVHTLRLRCYTPHAWLRFPHLFGCRSLRLRHTRFALPHGLRFAFLPTFVRLHTRGTRCHIPHHAHFGWFAHTLPDYAFALRAGYHTRLQFWFTHITTPHGLRYGCTHSTNVLRLYARRFDLPDVGPVAVPRLPFGCVAGWLPFGNCVGYSCRYPILRIRYRIWVITDTGPDFTARARYTHARLFCCSRLRCRWC